MADIARNHCVTVDEGHYYPHHNLYYISGPDSDALKLLACFLMSDFVRAQLQQLSPLMNGGYARWQSQHLRKLRVPLFQHLPTPMRAQLVQAYDKRQPDQIQALTQQILMSEASYTSEDTDLSEFAQLPLFAWAQYGNSSQFLKDR